MRLRAFTERAVTSRLVRGIAGFGLLVFATAPTPGDVGGCNQRAQPLDAEAFFTAKRNIDCSRCNECALAGKLCDFACGSGQVPAAFAEGCVPLVHDGEVCLRALEDASCSEYLDFVRDDAPTTPTECDFCPARSE